MSLSRARLGLVCTATLLAHAYFTGAFSWNQHARFAAVLTFVEPGDDRLTFRIDEYERRNPRAVQTHDWAIGADGYLYPNKAPGGAIVALPAYAALYFVESRLGIPLRDQDWTLWNAAVVNIWASSLWTAAATTVLLAFLCAGGWSPREARAPVLAYAFGTLVFPFGTSLWGHAPAAACVLMSACLAFWPTGVRWASLAGVLGGSAVLIEYPAAFALAAVGLALAARRATRREALLYAAGAALPLFVLAAYQRIVFGGFLTPAVAAGNPLFLSPGQPLGVIVAPQASVTWALLFSPYRGLFIYCPVLLFAGVGAWRRWQSGDRRVVAVALGAFVATLGLVSSFNGWWGGWANGPRYLIVTIPLLVLLLPAFHELSRGWRRVYAATLALSIANMTAIAAVDVMPDEAIRNPLYGVTYARLFSGLYPRSRLSGNFGADVLAWPAPFDLLPFVALVGVVVAVLWWGRQSSRTAR